MTAPRTTLPSLYIQCPRSLTDWIRSYEERDNRRYPR